MDFLFPHHAVFAHLSLARLELGLDEGQEPALLPHNGGGHRQNQPDGNEGHVHHRKIRAQGKLLQSQRPRVGALHDGNARVVAQPPVQLAVAHVDGVDVLCPVAQQHVGKAAGGRADVHGDRAGNVRPKGGNGFFQLMAAPAGELVLFAPHMQRRVLLHLLGGFQHLLFPHVYLPGHDQGLGLFPAFRHAPDGQPNVRPLLHPFTAFFTCSAMLLSSRP